MFGAPLDALELAPRRSVRQQIEVYRELGPGRTRHEVIWCVGEQHGIPRASLACATYHRTPTVYGEPPVFEPPRRHRNRAHLVEEAGREADHPVLPRHDVDALGRAVTGIPGQAVHNPQPSPGERRGSTEEEVDKGEAPVGEDGISGVDVALKVSLVLARRHLDVDGGGSDRAWPILLRTSGSTRRSSDLRAPRSNPPDRA